MSLLLLLLNDWVLKSAFPNGLTGKLSDVAGLFAFPFFLGVLWPRRAMAIHLGVALLFAWWKLPLSQGVIDALNGSGLPVSRTVDPSDLWALVSVPLSFAVFQKGFPRRLQPGWRNGLLAIALFAFTATSMPPREHRRFDQVNRTYRFKYGKRVLVARLNNLQLKMIYQINRVYGGVDYDREKGIFHVTGQTDTLALLLDHRTIGDGDTIVYRSSFVSLSIGGDEEGSFLTLHTLYHWVPPGTSKDYREQAVRLFERQVIRKLRRPTYGRVP